MPHVSHKLEEYEVDAKNEVDAKKMLADPNRLNEHLPWVHKFVLNAKALGQ